MPSRHTFFRSFCHIAPFFSWAGQILFVSQFVCLQGLLNVRTRGSWLSPLLQEPLFFFLSSLSSLAFNGTLLALVWRIQLKMKPDQKPYQKAPQKKLGEQSSKMMIRDMLQNTRLHLWPWPLVLLGSFCSFFFVIQTLIARYYGHPIDLQLALSAKRTWSEIWPQLKAMLPHFFLLCAALACAQISLLIFCFRIHPTPLEDGPIFSAALLGISLLASFPFSFLTPELSALRSLPAFFFTTPKQSIFRAHLPPLESLLGKGKVPHVLFILTESIREHDYCSTYRERCDVAPEVNALLPKRFGFRNMRSLASYTEVAFPTLLTGRPQLGEKKDLEQMPTLFDFAHVLSSASTSGQKEHIDISYFSSQPKMTLHEHIMTFAKPFIRQEDMNGGHGDDDDISFDQNMVDRFVAYVEGDAIRNSHSEIAPKFIFLHFYGTHAPYYEYPEKTPFKPSTHVVTWESLSSLHRAYQNAIFGQDHEVARAISAFMTFQHEARPWLIVFTSDHGEAFGEHKAIHHGQNTYDEQIHVPAFLAASETLFSPSQKERLREAELLPTTHLDLLPTLLEIYGLSEHPLALSYTSQFAGESLLRKHVHVKQKTLPLTNCTADVLCPLNNWGMLGKNVEIVAQPWDENFRCAYLHKPDEKITENSWIESPKNQQEKLPVPSTTENIAGNNSAECTQLKRDSLDFFPTLPNGKINSGNSGNSGNSIQINE